MDVHGVSATGAAPAATGADSSRLKAAAHEFEASLMKEFLKPLEHDSLFADKQTDSDDEEGGDEGSAGAIMSFGSQAMATAISERGGFGIATMILNHFQRSSSAAQAGSDSHHQGNRTTGVAPRPKVFNAIADERR
ncbi:MAG TPA: hypothetical protein VE178_21710 [Silvibacterium sp.]|jgi:Rod binding domain-containing protein|nr:hypothetical protein [Silvibacterium sp.]